MAIVAKVDPKGVDNVIDAIQQYIFPNLTGAGWTDYECYPRANKNPKDGNIIPEVAKDRKNYKEVLFNDNFNATSFFLVDDRVEINNVERLIVQRVSLIFQVRLDKLFATVPHRADEELHVQLTQLLTQNEELFVDIVGYWTTPAQVYADLRLGDHAKGNTVLDDMSDFHVVRYDFLVTYDLDECDVKFSPVCTPVPVTFNGAGVTPVNSGNSKAVIVQTDDTVPLLTGNILVDTMGELRIEVAGASGLPPIYYQRPWLTTTVVGLDYDESWRILNPGDVNSGGGNTYNESIPDNSTIQQKDFDSLLFDRLKYFNVWGHKFRFTGVLGGYCNPDDGLFYDVNDDPSDKATEFPPYSGTKALVTDHLTGLQHISDRLGTVPWNSYMPETPGRTDAGFTDWFAPSFAELWILTDPDLIDCLNFGGNEPRRAQFNYSQPTLWCGTTSSTNNSQALRMVSNGLGGLQSVGTKSLTGANRIFQRVELTGTIPQP